MGEHHLPSFLQLQSWLGSASQFRTYGKPQRPGLTQEPRTNATGAVDAYRGNSTFLGPRSDARVGRPLTAWPDASGSRRRVHGTRSASDHATQPAAFRDVGSRTRTSVRWSCRPATA